MECMEENNLSRSSYRAIELPRLLPSPTAGSHYTDTQSEDNLQPTFIFAQATPRNDRYAFNVRYEGREGSPPQSRLHTSRKQDFV
ncbi:hypothetical protein VTL71DRAFT_15181, partial [Oculimacula yallundae]